MTTTKQIIHFFLLTAALSVGIVVAGCDNKETILDVDTSDGGVEVERDRDDGSITVDVGE